MSEAVYAQVEDAIARRLHVMVPGGGLFGPGYRYPVGIEHGNIVMRDSDCGLAKPVIVWTTDQWRTHVDESGRGLYKKVGFWSFEAADDPAANDIRLCHQSPGSTGRQLYAMRGEIERLRAALKQANSQAEHFEREWYLRGDEIDKLRAAVEALAALVQRDRVALYQAHAHPVTGAVDEAGQSGLDEYDAALRLADEAMGEGK